MQFEENNFNRQIWIDGLKGISILGVIIAHFGIQELPESWKPYFSFGARGVEVFFIVGAYLAFSSLEKISKSSTLQWYKKKMINLIPLYYTSLVLYLLILGGYQYWLGSVGRVTSGNIISHLFFLHVFNPYWMDSIQGIEWYLGVYVIFLLMAPFLHKIINSLEKALCFFMASLFINECIVRLPSPLPEIDYYIWKDYISAFCITAKLPVIALGIILFFLIKERVLEQYIGRKYLSYLILGLGMFLLYNLINGGSFPVITIYIVYGMVFMLIIFSQIIYPSKILCNKLFVIMGKNSYGIYLLHFFFIRLKVGKYVLKLGIENPYCNWILGYVLIVGLSYGCAEIFNYIVAMIKNIVLKERKKL